MATVGPANYLDDILDMLGRHRVEFVLTLGAAVLAAAALAAGTSLHLLSILLPAIAASLLFEMGAAMWRVYRRQRISIATTRSLLDLNAADLAGLEQRLLTRYRNRERRLEDGHAARVTRLTGDIAALQGAAGRESIR
ncbi:MAG TPA: hypothetical protein VF850_03000, partial [Gemmatimonadaceae bacterium]